MVKDYHHLQEVIIIFWIQINLSAIIMIIMTSSVINVALLVYNIKSLYHYFISLPCLLDLCYTAENLFDVDLTKQ